MTGPDPGSGAQSAHWVNIEYSDGEISSDGEIQDEEEDLKKQVEPCPRSAARQTPSVAKESPGEALQPEQRPAFTLPPELEEKLDWTVDLDPTDSDTEPAAKSLKCGSTPSPRASPSLHRSREPSRSELQRRKPLAELRPRKKRLQLPLQPPLEPPKGPRKASKSPDRRQRYRSAIRMLKHHGDKDMRRVRLETPARRVRLATPARRVRVESPARQTRLEEAFAAAADRTATSERGSLPRRKRSPSLGSSERRSRRSLPRKRAKKWRRYKKLQGSRSPSPRRRRSSSRPRPGRAKKAVLIPGLPPAPPSRPEAEAEEKQDRHWKEIFVGNLVPDVDGNLVMKILEDALKELPEYQERYSADFKPLLGFYVPRAPTERRERDPKKGFIYLFLYTADAVLASTLVLMSGIEIRGRSARIGRPSFCSGKEPPRPGLDVRPIADKLPFSGGVKLREVWVGGLAAAVREKPELLREKLNELLLSLPSYKERYPDEPEPAVSVKMCKDMPCAFVEVISEVVAATLLHIREITIHGRKMDIGMPSYTKEKVGQLPPPLEVTKDIGRPDDEAAMAELAEIGSGMEILQEKAECEIFLGGVASVEVPSLWAALGSMLESVPSYQELYPDLEDPILNIRISDGNKKSYGFARLHDSVLASTAVAVQWIRVGKDRVIINRPAHYASPPEGDVPALQLPPQPKVAATISKPMQIVQVVMPPPPAPPTPMLWVGGLPPNVPFDRLKDALDLHFTELALEGENGPEFDFESGAPLKHISVNKEKRYAFVELKDSAVMDKLLRLGDGSMLMGHALSVSRMRNHRRRRNVEEDVDVQVEEVDEEVRGRSPSAFFDLDKDL